MPRRRQQVIRFGFWSWSLDLSVAIAWACLDFSQTAYSAAWHSAHALEPIQDAARNASMDSRANVSPN
jgi:hypothetical protein